MRTNYLPTYLLVWLLLALIGCVNNSEHPDTPPSQIDLYVRYLEGEKQIKAEATLKIKQKEVGEQIIPFTEGIHFHGRPMQEKSLPGGIRYMTQFNTPFPDSVTFRYTNLNDTETEQTIHLQPMKNIKVSNQTLTSSSKENTLWWEGPPLSAYESCVILISDSQNETHVIEFKGPTESTALRLSKDHLSDIALGEATFYIVRKGTQKSRNPSRVITSSYEYYSTSQKIPVTK